MTTEFDTLTVIYDDAPPHTYCNCEMCMFTRQAISDAVNQGDIIVYSHDHIVITWNGSATFNMYVLGDNVDAFTVYGCETLADAIESAQSHMDDIGTASDEFLSGESS